MAEDVRDPLARAGIYRVHCNCGQVYIGTTKRSNNTRTKEHERHCRLQQMGKSTILEDEAITEHKVEFNQMQAVATITYYHARIYREAIEFYKQPNNVNRKEEILLAMPGYWFSKTPGSMTLRMRGNQQEKNMWCFKIYSKFV